MNISNKLTNLKARKFGEDINKAELFKNFSETLSEQLLYITEAMSPVSASYTANTFEQCNRVQEQLKSNISHIHAGIEFQYQGSVPLNTHTRRHSDVDVLVATGRFHWVVPPLTPVYPYFGDAKNDLIELRADIVKTIESVFPAVSLDNSGGKAIAISGGSLNRKMDLVPMSWVHNSLSKGNPNLTHRGIKLYDAKSKDYVENYPFLHIFLCNEKDGIVAGRFKKLVRYIKNVRKDSEQKIDISSYDATALMYHCDNLQLLTVANEPAALSVATERYLKWVIENVEFQKTVKVPNGTRLLFGDEGLKIGEVIKLYQEVQEINIGLIVAYSSINPYRRKSLEEYFQKA